MKRSIVLLLAVTATSAAISPSAALAQGWGSGGGLWALQNEQIRKELEIVDEQLEQLTELRDEAMTQMRESWGGLRDLEPEERQEKMAELREKMSAMQKELQAKADKILLPHQAERLKQINMQMRLRSRGTSRALMDGELAETLKISDEQKEQIEEAAKKATEEMNEKIATARKEAREQVLKALTPEQRAQLEKLIGEEFEWNTQQRGQGQRTRGAFGRRGGSAE